MGDWRNKDASQPNPCGTSYLHQPGCDGALSKQVCVFRRRVSINPERLGDGILRHAFWAEVLRCPKQCNRFHGRSVQGSGELLSPVSTPSATSDLALSRVTLVSGNSSPLIGAVKMLSVRHRLARCYSARKGTKRPQARARGLSPGKLTGRYPDFVASRPLPAPPIFCCEHREPSSVPRLAQLALSAGTAAENSPTDRMR